MNTTPSFAYNIFITGTDTDVGKTYISTRLLTTLNLLGYQTVGLKPIASGCIKRHGTLLNEDALALQQAASRKLPLSTLNPYQFLLPIAPHIAANKQGIVLTSQTLQDKLTTGLTTQCDIRIIEGAGGWLLPLNERETMADFVSINHFAVILVVRIKLGCLNHALLTAHAIQHTGLPFLGWIGNCMDEDIPMLHEQIDTLLNWLRPPCLGIIGQHADHQAFLRTDWSLLLNQLNKLNV